MITIALRVLCITAGVFFAVPSYASALKLNNPTRWEVSRLRWHLFWAVVSTTIAAVGIVGWGSR